MANLPTDQWRCRAVCSAALLSLAASALFAAVTSRALGQDCLWQFRSATGPAQRSKAAMAYDSQRGVVVLFGGRARQFGVYFSDTWEWDGATWTLVAESGPSPRFRSAMAYDSRRGVMVLYGGDDSSPQFLDDTWEWDGQEWTQRHIGGALRRQGHSLAYDSVRGETVLFGGADDIRPRDPELGDTWVWNGIDDKWHQVSETGPGPRTLHAAAFDALRGVMVLFGGEVAEGSHYRDTWEWNGSDWIQRVEWGGPPQRQDHGMAYDERRGVTVLFGGKYDNPPPLNDTWAWDGSVWAETAFTVNPAARYEHSLVYDSGRSVTVLFGGADGSNFYNDTWELGCEHSLALLPLVGECPGTMRATVHEATPSGNVAFVFGLSEGRSRIPSGPCAGTELPIAQHVMLVAAVRSNANGEAQIRGSVAPGACGGRLVAVDASTCAASNVRVIE